MQKDYSKPGRYASAAPAWNRDDGHYVLKRVGDVDSFALAQPSIHIICDPLMGISVRDGEQWRVKYLHSRERIRIYERALQVLVKWRTRDDLFSLALYRRQVACANLPDVDEAFFAVALQMRPHLTCMEWRMLAERMPEFTLILNQCKEQVRWLEKAETVRRVLGLSKSA